MTHIWFLTLFYGAIIIFQGVQTKFHFMMKFPHLEKFVDLLKNLKYEHQGTFPLWGGSNSILGTGTENQIFILRNPATIKFFVKFSKTDEEGPIR